MVDQEPPGTQPAQPAPAAPAGPAAQGDIETVQVGDRWVNRLVGTRAVLAVNLTRSSALAAGAALARSWRVHHQVVYHQTSPPDVLGRP